MSVYDRLCSFAKIHGLSVARSDSDSMRLALVCDFEIISGVAFPWNVYPNAMQAYRFLKSQHEMKP